MKGGIKMNEELTKLQSKRAILNDIRSNRGSNKIVNHLSYLKEHNYSKYLKVKGLIDRGLSKN